MERRPVWWVTSFIVMWLLGCGGGGGTQRVPIPTSTQFSIASDAYEWLFAQRQASGESSGAGSVLGFAFPPEFIFPQEPADATEGALVGGTAQVRDGLASIRGGLSWSAVSGPDSGPDGTPGWYWWDFAWGSLAYRFYVKTEPAHDFRQGWPENVSELWWGWTGESEGMKGVKFVWHQASKSEQTVSADYSLSFDETVVNFLGTVILAGTWEKGTIEWTVETPAPDLAYEYVFSAGAHVLIPEATLDGYVGSRGKVTPTTRTWTYYEGIGSAEDPKFEERPAWKEGEDPAGPAWAKGLVGSERGGLLEWLEATWTTSVENGETFYESCFDSWYHTGRHFHACTAPDPLFSWKGGCFQSVKVVKGDFTETDLPATAPTIWGLEAKRTVLSEPLRFRRKHPAAKTTVGTDEWFLSKGEPYTLVLGKKGGEVLRVGFVGGVKTLALDVEGDPCDPAVASVQVSPATAEVQEGQSADFTARALDANGKDIPEVDFVWAVDPALVAGIHFDPAASNVAHAKGNAEGQARIWANAEGVWGYATLTVKPAPETPTAAEYELGEDEEVNNIEVTASAYGGLAHLGENRFFIAWSDQAKLYYDVAPSVQPDVEQPSSATSISMGLDCVLPGPQGRVYVVWNGTDPITKDWRIHISELEPAAERKIRDHRLPLAEPYLAVACASDKANRAYLLVRSPSPQWEMKNSLVFVSDNGLNTFNQVGMISLWDPRVTGAGNEAYVVGVAEGVWLQKVSGKTALGDPVRVASADDWPVRPRVAITPKGKVFVAWALEGVPGVLRIASSEDGKTFAEPQDAVRLEEGWYVGEVEVTADEAGVVHVFYVAYQSEQVSLNHIATQDGVAFSKPKQVNDHSEVGMGRIIGAKGGQSGAAVVFEARPNLLFDLAVPLTPK